MHDHWRHIVLLHITLICLITAGCQPPDDTTTNTQLALAGETVTPTETAQPSSPISPTSTATKPPPPVILSTMTPLTPTETPLPPTDTPIPPTPIPPTSTPTPTHTPMPRSTYDPTVCRPLSETAGSRSPYVVTGANWARPGAWSNEVGVASGGGYKIMHLGFDVEGSDAQLPALLDMLDRHRVKTTMFIMGSWSLGNYADWVTEMSNRGHEMANHTWTHSDIKTLSKEAFQQELLDTEARVQTLTGHSTKPWFRPPYGSRNAETIAAAYELGWTHIIWSGSTEDWRPGTTAEKMCATLKGGAYPGAILYSHTSHPEIATAIEMFISEMQLEGYTFVPLSVLLATDPGLYLTAQND